ncbi:hypothetical protein E3N88_15611 [Mikania micrantha]|uniref:Uncharacterized protein n=1 Tax=Mikania micrantha TaxID=192012 RepID=A0A5N6NXQ2_9ASTR|nr:hypothetical protein E3N88_15611 [Mikania micrantha]
MAATTRNSIIAAQLSTISVRLDAILTSLKEDISAIKTQMIGNGCYNEKTNDYWKNTIVEDGLKADKRDELINSDNMKDCHQILEFKSDKQIHHKGSMVFEDGGDEDQEEEDEASDSEGDGSNPDLAWKLIVDERSIVEKQSGDTMEKVNILSALAKVALEREDVDISLNDYSKALSMLERLAEPDSICMAKLNFRICLCLKLGPNGSGFHSVLKSLMGNFSGVLEKYEGDIFWNKDVKADLKLRDLNFVDLRTSRFSMGDVLIQTRVTTGFDLVKLSGQK